MGCAGSKTDPAQAERDREISRKLAGEKKVLSSEVKLLLLGAGESGKSTFAKQMKILHLRGFTEEEKQNFRSVVWDNLMTCALQLVKGAQELGIDSVDEAVSSKILEHEDYAPEDVLELKDTLAALWSDAGIQQAYARSAEFQLLDSTSFFFERLDTIVHADYVPDEQDILRSRTKTTGIIETEFTVQKVKFRMVDVGGQRNERKKWMHCFQDVTAVIFCVALSEYDQKLDEDNMTNRTHESMEVFKKEVCDNQWFKDTSIILFLNKEDLFREKIKRVNITTAFPEYTGGQNFEEASEYIKQQYLSMNDNPNKSVYPHITCATNTSNIKHVFAAVKDIILQEAFGGAF